MKYWIKNYLADLILILILIQALIFNLWSTKREWIIPDSNQSVDLPALPDDGGDFLREREKSSISTASFFGWKPPEPVVKRVLQEPNLSPPIRNGRDFVYLGYSINGDGVKVVMIKRESTGQVLLITEDSKDSWWISAETENNLTITNGKEYWRIEK